MSEIAQEVKPITHRELVDALKKPAAAVANDLNGNTEAKVVLLKEAENFVTQANRLDLVKKQAIYNKPQGISATSVTTNRLEGHFLSDKQADLLHMAVGIAGEAGELLEAILHHILYQQALDKENVVEELGDLEFYIEGFRNTLNIPREETISQNISKLSVRYSSGTYSDAQAQDRADKTGD